MIVNIEKNFDKILLTTLVLIFAGLAFRGYHVGNDSLASFAADSSKLFSGALLTLITGRLLSGSSQGNSFNGTSTQSVASTTTTAVQTDSVSESKPIKEK